MGDQSDGIQDLSIFQKTMFLSTNHLTSCVNHISNPCSSTAEDRILSFELIAKQGEKWTVSYVKDSKAETDVPECVAELIAQRRRWLNGGLATGIYALTNLTRLHHSAHGWRQLGLYHVQAVVCLVPSMTILWRFVFTYLNTVQTGLARILVVCIGECLALVQCSAGRIVWTGPPPIRVFGEYLLALRMTTDTLTPGSCGQPDVEIYVSGFPDDAGMLNLYILHFMI
jgi:cellulose synthase/poly-beta-1,6-N-acetylglucosamine synthase-like glycosyltransferase